MTSTAKIVVITSGKGGVGKSGICINSALLLARMGYRTCLFDGDLGTANANILLGLDQEHSLDDVLSGSKKLVEIIKTTPFGFDLIPGSSGVERIANLDAPDLQRLADSFSALSDYDYFLVDTGAGIGRHVVSFCLASQESVVVITPEATSLTDSYALLKVLAGKGYSGNIRILLNNCPDIAVARKIYSRYRKVVDKHLRLAISPIGVIFKDPLFGQAILDRRPLLHSYPDSIAASCLHGFVANLESASPPAGDNATLGSFWHRYLKQMRPLQSSARTTTTDIQSTQSQPSCLPAGSTLKTPLGIARTAFSLLQREIFDDARELIRNDPSLTIALLQLIGKERGRAGHGGASLDACISSLPSEQLHNLLLTVATSVAFAERSHGQEKQLEDAWLRSNHCARAARQLACDNRYPHPEDAWLCGLLARHAGVNRTLLNSLGVASLLSDAVELSTASTEQVQSGLELVRLTFLAGRMADAIPLDSDPAALLPYCTPDGLATLDRTSLQKSRELAARYQLQEVREETYATVRERFRTTLLHYLLIQGIMPPPAARRDGDETLNRICDTMRLLFGFPRVICLTVQDEERRLRFSSTPADTPLLQGMSISLECTESVLHKALSTGEMMLLTEVDGSTVLLDRQLHTMLGNKGLLCLPLLHGGKKVGLLLSDVNGQRDFLDINQEQLQQFALRAGRDLAALSTKSSK